MCKLKVRRHWLKKKKKGRALQHSFPDNAILKTLHKISSVLTVMPFYLLHANAVLFDV